MAGELQYRTDGSLLIIESGANIGSLAHECCCASDDPCTDCGNAQAATTITIAGVCASQSCCDDAAGVYAFDSYAACQWKWKGPLCDGACPGCGGGTFWWLVITWDGANWAIEILGDTVNYFSEDPSTDIVCIRVGGNYKLTGSVSIPGWDLLKAGDCTGCTATFTL